MSERAVVGEVQLMVKAMYLRMSAEEYERLPDRQDVLTLPLDGLTYKDRAHPGLIFRCRSGPDWARYAFDTFAPELT